MRTGNRMPGSERMLRSQDVSKMTAAPFRQEADCLEVADFLGSACISVSAIVLLFS
jgi:hypothetical protein